MSGHRRSRAVRWGLAAATLAAISPPAAPAASGGTSASPLPFSASGPPARAGGPVVARLSTRVATFGGRRRPALAYALRRGGARTVRVDLVRGSDGAVVARWGPERLPPGALRAASWNGRAGSGAAPGGRYEFRLYAGAAAAGGGGSGPPAVADSFVFLDHAFPIRGPHDYGTAVNRFGPVSGRGHRGQDVLADCGVPLVAARAGRVKVRDSVGAAGNYLVIDGDATPIDYVYMHLREPALVRPGQHVATGQLVGHVGDTGNSTACHLHFELWAGPWWAGGRPLDPLPWLRAWERAGAAARAGRLT